MKDGRILLTWNYNARDEAKKYEARPLLFSMSADDGDTWTPLQCFGKLTDRDLGAVRNSVLEWTPRRWLLVPRDHRPVLYDVKTRKLEPFDIEFGKAKKTASLQVIRTAKGFDDIRCVTEPDNLQNRRMGRAETAEAVRG